MKVIAHLLHDSFLWIAFGLLVLLAVLFLPAAAILTRALIPITAAAVAGLFIATCCSRRLRNWIYS
jgi:hypothetical protein